MNGRRPANLDAETAVLSAMLCDPGKALAAAQALCEDDFTKEPRQSIFRCARRLTLAGRPVDLVTVTDALSEEGQLSRIGGRDFVQSILDSVPAFSHVVDYFPILRRMSARRALVSAGERQIERVLRGDDPAEIAVDAGSELAAIGQRIDARPGAGVEPIEILDLAGDVVPPRWIIPGYIALDEVGPLAGDPGEGKTTLAADWCWSIATGRPSIGITPEITGPVIYFGEDCGVDETRRLFQRLGGSHPNLHVCAEQDLRLDEPSQVARIEAAVDKVRPVFMVFDTLRAMLGGDENDSAIITDCGRVLRRLIRRRNGECAIVLLHHLRKSWVGEAWGPQLLRGSGALRGLTQFVLAVRRDPLDREVTQLHRWKRRGRPEKPHMLFRYSAGDGDTSRIELIGIGPGDDDAQGSQSAKARAAGLARKALEERGPLGLRDLRTIGQGSKVNKRTMDRAVAYLKKTGTIQQEPGKGGRYYLPGQETAL